MKSTRYDGYLGPRLPRELQLKRVQRVIREELTPIQQEVILAFYLHQQSAADIARQRSVHRSTVTRTLHRAEGKLRRFLKY